MSGSVPFHRWIEAGCPEVYDYDGMRLEATDVISIEYESVHEFGPTVLEDAECERLGIPPGSTNQQAIDKLRERWPLPEPDS